MNDILNEYFPEIEDIEKIYTLQRDGRITLPQRVLDVLSLKPGDHVLITGRVDDGVTTATLNFHKVIPPSASSTQST